MRLRPGIADRRRDTFATELTFSMEAANWETRRNRNDVPNAPLNRLTMTGAFYCAYASEQAR